MAQTPEKKVKTAVSRLLVEMGIYYFMPAANGFGRAGIPDIICCFGGRFIAIECKAGKGTTTALQDRELAAIRTAGGMAVVVNETNIDELKEKLQWMR
jgi:Holliday junction resolvase